MILCIICCMCGSLATLLAQEFMARDDSSRGRSKGMGSAPVAPLTQMPMSTAPENDEPPPCQHLNVTRTGTNGYVRIRRCKDCKALLEHTVLSDTKSEVGDKDK